MYRFLCSRWHIRGIGRDGSPVIWEDGTLSCGACASEFAVETETKGTFTYEGVIGRLS